MFPSYHGARLQIITSVRLYPILGTLYYFDYLTRLNALILYCCIIYSYFISFIKL